MVAAACFGAGVSTARRALGSPAGVEAFPPALGLSAAVVSTLCAVSPDAGVDAGPSASQRALGIGGSRAGVEALPLALGCGSASTELAEGFIRAGGDRDATSWTAAGTRKAGVDAPEARAGPWDARSWAWAGVDAKVWITWHALGNQALVEGFVRARSNRDTTSGGIRPSTEPSGYDLDILVSSSAGVGAK